MEMHNALVESSGEKKILRLVFSDTSFEIPLTEDEPKKIKSVFNELIKRLKTGPFNFNFSEDGNDLFVQISKEYISQLNRELTAVHEEMKHFNLLTLKS